MSEITSMIVTIGDVRDAKLCMKGCREWFGNNGLSWDKFVTQGLPIEEIEATGDRLCKIVTDKTRARYGR